MAKQKRTLLDELAKRLRDLVDDLDRLSQPQRKPVRVPVPVRPQQPPNYPDKRYG